MPKPREKDRERDTDSPKSKDRPRHRSSRSSRKVDKASTPPDRRSTNASPAPTKRRSSMPVPESEKGTTSISLLASKTSLPYPSFSKAHSKEAVGSREDVAKQRLSYYTPDPTDLERGKENGAVDGVQPTAGAAPPSPPETTMDQKSRTEKPKVDTVKVERKRSDLQKAADDLKRRLGRAKSDVTDRKDRESRPSRSRNSLRESSKEEDRYNLSARRSKPSTLRPKQPTVEDSASSTASQLKPPSSVQSTAKSEDTNGSTIDSGATERPISPRPDRDSSPATGPDSSPRTPTLTEPNFPPSWKETPAFSAVSTSMMPGGVGESPMPPPPPPPPQVLQPKVDYLIQHGGLPQPVPRNLQGALPPSQTPQTGSAPLESIFAPFHDLFDKYDRVMARSGSIAVATGYRSVARRLLDRLEAVFARDISSETCTCVLCQSCPDYDMDIDDKRGVSWGEILEYVCGRQELPQWPAFVMDSTQTGLGILPGHEPPMQKLDVDVPEEFRDHYIRQSKKTKQSVDKWLESQPHQPSSPPQDVDDDTLTFAMLTCLEPEQRPIFSSLVGMQQSRPASTTGEPTLNPASEHLQQIGLAIQRLYRLSNPPRDPESAIYLLMNPSLHDVLATLAAISDGEWDLLTSGRFDGFLRSGAEDTPTPPTTAPPPSRLPSRGPPSRMSSHPNPPPSRGPTPATAGAPITLDEETEIATLAEVEREIFLSMETLENAFESLHLKAETIRRIMRERGAGLAQANQERRGSTPVDLRMGTPASFAWESETDDGFDDGASEVWPDDSASNISSSRHRRPKRRHERRTPALVEEDEEESAGDGGKEMEEAGGKKRSLLGGSKLGKRR